MEFGHGASAWQQVHADDGAAPADPHRVAMMSMDCVLERLVKVRAHMLRGEMVAKGESISRCVEILTDLRDGLDPQLEPALTGRLDALYEHMCRRLLQANLRDDATVVDEVGKLMQQVRDSWAQLDPTSLRRAVAV